MGIFMQIRPGIPACMYLHSSPSVHTQKKSTCPKHTIKDNENAAGLFLVGDPRFPEYHPIAWGGLEGLRCSKKTIAFLWSWQDHGSTGMFEAKFYGLRLQ